MFRARKLTAALAVALAVPLAAAGFAGELLTASAASAATPSCGVSCIDVFSRDFGTHRTPAFALDVLRQGEKAGQPLILFRTSNADPAEDFTVSFQGLVSDFFQAGLASSAVNLHYGCGWSPVTGQCSTTRNPVTGKPFPDDYAFEVEYSPYGVQSGLCAGTGSVAASGTKVALEPCGVTSETVWVIDQADASSLSPVLNEYVPLINGSDTNFSHPFVLTYPSGAEPTAVPRAQFATQNLTGFSSPGNGDPQGVVSNQMFGADFGVLK